uniref:Transcriptional-regulating factor 1 n=1 Tax=Dicentrarchus labrax TaxID=13489 RepID=A0A8P4G609_DICLA
MSDLWPFSSSSPIIHHSSPFISSPPPLSSPTSTGNHGNPPHAKVPSYHLPEQQVTSPHHLPPPQVTSPHYSHPQATSPYPCPLQVTSPPIVPETQVPSPHLLYHNQVTSPHHLPHSNVTSPHFAPHSQVTSPHLLSPLQHHFSNQNHDPGFDNPDWSGPEPPSDLSYLLKSYSYSCQNQNTAHLDLQNQNQFGTGGELENRLPYNAHTHLGGGGGVYDQGVAPGPVQDVWRPLGPTLSQLQCSPLGSTSGEVGLGRWSSMEFSSSPADDSSGVQFFYDGCHDNNAPQPFCSPNTPGPSPHYPQTPTISSPGPQMHLREGRPDFHTSRQLSRDKALSCCLQEYDSYPLTSDPGQQHPQQASQHLLQSQTELIQDQKGLLDAASNSKSCFPPQGRGQDVSGAAQAPSLPAGRSWKEECGGGGRGGRGRRGGGNNQPDWNWMKRPQPKSSPEVLDCRLQCTVCKRDFRSLPALNGHMRSHSGSRSATWLNKGEDSSPLVPPSISMVMPVTVPVQPRAAAKVCRGGPRRCSRLSPPSARAVLYRSLMHLEEEEEEAVAKGDGPVSSGADVAEDGVVTRGDGGVHYTPPPMLCPLRAGPGLYCSLTSRRQQRVQTVQIHNNGLDDLVATETASPLPGTLTTGINTPYVINTPRINVGRGFQAEVPPLRAQRDDPSDSHNALLLWTPWDELERPVNQQRVEALLTMARSSVVPGGGASPESALHVLSECRGDFLLTVEKLLLTPETSNNNNNHTPHPAGVSWSSAERRSLVKSLQLHHKDFSQVQKAVQTKTVSQCVEFYYLWKKKLSLRTPATLTVTLPASNGQRSSKTK